MQVGVGTGGGLSYLEVRPEQASENLPLVVALHGRGASAEDLAPLAGEVGAAYRWIFPNARLRLSFDGWEGYAWYDLEAPERDIPASRKAIEALLGDLWVRHGQGPTRTVLLGFSQGAVLAFDVGLRAAARFAGLVAMSGYLAEIDDIAAAARAARDQRLLVIHGLEDPILPIARGRAARHFLETAGLQPAYHELAMGHEVTRESLALVERFLADVLPADAR